MTTALADRCQRCGTKIRNKRTICPSCGMDLSAAKDQGASEESPATPAIKKVVAKAGVKMCAICMMSVPDDQLVEQDGQKICPTCAENMKNKALRKSSSPPK